MVTYSNKNRQTSIREVSYSNPHHGKIETENEHRSWPISFLKINVSVNVGLKMFHLPAVHHFELFT